MAAIIVGVDVTKPNPKKAEIKAEDRRITAGVVGMDVTKKAEMPKKARPSTAKE